MNKLPPARGAKPGRSAAAEVVAAKSRTAARTPPRPPGRRCPGGAGASWNWCWSPRRSTSPVAMNQRRDTGIVRGLPSRAKSWRMVRGAEGQTADPGAFHRARASQKKRQKRACRYQVSAERAHYQLEQQSASQASLRPADTHHSKLHSSKGVVMHWSLKIASAVLLGFALLTGAAADAHAGRPGGSGHAGSRPPSGHAGGRHHGHGGHRRHHIRHHGRFSHRHWDRRFHRWMYFDPGYNRWYVRYGAEWLPVPVEDAPGIPYDDPDE
jgi:hypothetical protein